jgi:DNA-binding response OmpR family regulator
MRPTVLVADDDSQLRDLYRIFLGERGYEIETAADGLDCLEKLRATRPAVLVVDLGLRWGGCDGVLAWLREGHTPSGIPVILTGTADSPPDGVEPHVPPVVDYLPKPFGLMTLLERVRASVARQIPEGWDARDRAEHTRRSAN